MSFESWTWAPIGKTVLLWPRVTINMNWFDKKSKYNLRALCNHLQYSRGSCPSRVYFVHLPCLRVWRYSVLPLVVKGVPMDPNSEKYFPEWIWRWNAGHWWSNPKEPNTANKSKIGYTITKWRPKNQLPSRDIKFPTKNGKPLSRRNFSLKFGS